MNAWLGVGCLIACGVMATPAWAQKPDAYSGASTVTVAAAADDLGWLSGRWCWQRGETLIEETWLPKQGDIWFGISRSIKAGVTTEFEFVRIAMHDGTLSYLAQPQGRPATAFARTGGGDGWIQFENAAHDFPQRIVYRRVGEQLQAEIAGPGKDGKLRTMEFPYQQCP